MAGHLRGDVGWAAMHPKGEDAGERRAPFLMELIKLLKQEVIYVGFVFFFLFYSGG